MTPKSRGVVLAPPHHAPSAVRQAWSFPSIWIGYGGISLGCEHVGAIGSLESPLVGHFTRNVVHFVFSSLDAFNVDANPGNAMLEDSTSHLPRPRYIKRV
ncbi:hypothetical protein N7471_013986 [Penicillium samsonianum]|uniref:uncharacterized protein n=1 Tax=Penicillium samsonianum TaxID=1882272 RepID=UPI002548FFEB|nr:uncharacterized protein N7471_013986 [Penicillium samsonianum]KAJ6118109.1 hypothetical protein N7471_013986 [Penicillium samsonianum]